MRTGVDAIVSQSHDMQAKQMWGFETMSKVWNNRERWMAWYDLTSLMMEMEFSNSANSSYGILGKLCNFSEFLAVCFVLFSVK